MPDFVTCKACGELLSLRDGRLPAGGKCPVCGAALGSATLPKPVSETLKVLLIEDDPIMVEAMAARLRAAGYRVTCATDSLTGIQMVRRERPDAIILDLNLPAGDGFTVIERLRNLNPVRLTPIVVVSGNDAASSGPKAKALGAKAYLQKPITTQQLLDALDLALQD